MRRILFQIATYWTRDSRVERIRRQMLDEMRPLAALAGHAELQLWVMRATDAQALWELRPALRELLAAQHPEQVVQFKMASISFGFAGLLRRPAELPMPAAPEPQRNFG
jgi:hypothetical protein